MLDFIINQNKFPQKCLIGNHEAMLLSCEDQPNYNNAFGWLMNGGWETLQSYGASSFPDLDELRRMDADKVLGYVKLNLHLIPDYHLQFLASLEDRYHVDNVFFSHAGTNPSLSLEDQSNEDLIWGSKPFLTTSLTDNLYVHGHWGSSPSFHVNLDDNLSCVQAALINNGQVKEILRAEL